MLAAQHRLQQVLHCRCYTVDTEAPVLLALTGSGRVPHRQRPHGFTRMCVFFLQPATAPFLSPDLSLPTTLSCSGHPGCGVGLDLCTHCHAPCTQTCLGVC